MKDISVPPLEMKILNILWNMDGPITVQEIIDEWPDKPLPGYTTVLKKLQVMEKKKFVHHSRDGKQYRYFPILEKESVSRMKIKDVLSQVFLGNKFDFVHSVLKETVISPEDREEIRQMIDSLEDSNG